MVVLPDWGPSLINKVSKGGKCYRRIYGISFSEGKSGFTGAFTDSDPNPLGEVVQGGISVKLKRGKIAFHFCTSKNFF